MGGEQADASVKLTVVLTVLAAHGVEISIDAGSPAKSTVLIKGEIVEAYTFPAAVHRRMLHRLVRRFDIPIHHFYRPELATAAATKPPTAAPSATAPVRRIQPTG